MIKCALLFFGGGAARRLGASQRSRIPPRLRRQQSPSPFITIPPAKQAKLNFLKLQLCKRNVLRLDMSAVISIENFRVSPTIILKLGQVFTKSLK